MKLGTSSPLAHESAEEWAAKHRSLGLEAINFHLTCEDDPSVVDEYVKKAAEYGLVIAEVGVWRNTLDPDGSSTRSIREILGSPSSPCRG